jgi:hypothetical protein
MFRAVVTYLYIYGDMMTWIAAGGAEHEGAHCGAR